MSDYTITKVSENDPRSWSFVGREGKRVPMETYRVMVSDREGPVEVNRKPGNRPSVGEVLTGTITEDEYGAKFKTAPKPRSGGFSADPVRQADIKAEWAIGKVVDCLGVEDLIVVETKAKQLFAMVERVKAGPSPASGYDQARSVADKLKFSEADSF